MISMAFTSYSKVDSHLVLFDWVGLENFKLIFNSGSSIGQSFWSVFGWTIIWAVLATFLNYSTWNSCASILLIIRSDTNCGIAIDNMNINLQNDLNLVPFLLISSATRIPSI